MAAKLRQETFNSLVNELTARCLMNEMGDQMIRRDRNLADHMIATHHQSAAAVHHYCMYAVEALENMGYDLSTHGEPARGPDLGTFWNWWGRAKEARLKNPPRPTPDFVQTQKLFAESEVINIARQAYDEGFADGQAATGT